MGSFGLADEGVTRGTRGEASGTDAPEASPPLCTGMPGRLFLSVRTKRRVSVWLGEHIILSSYGL